MRFRLAWFVALSVDVSLALTTSVAFGQTAKDSDIHVSAITEFFALHKYPRHRRHKVIVVGPGGYWSDNSGIGNAERALKGTLAACNSMLQNAEYKSLRNRKCVAFDVDGRRTGKATPIGIPFGTVAPGADTPLDFGNSWEATTSARRGTLLFLHGCKPIREMNGWLWSWVNFYRAAGLRVVMPNSFAEVRDPELCGWPGENGIDQQTRILKLRAAQTLRNIASLKKKYPGEALYIHGHSEGGYVAQALGAKVDGIIVTGSPCGFGASQAYWVGEGVRVLVIAGTKDPYFAQAKTGKALTRYCRQVTGTGRMTWVSIPGMAHYTALWWPGVQDAVAKLLDIHPAKIGRASKEDGPYPDPPKNVMDYYKQAANPKALAISKTGAWNYSMGMESVLDAEETALFGCDHASGADAYLDSEHRHHCVLVDVNGKRMLK